LGLGLLLLLQLHPGLRVCLGVRFCGRIRLGANV
jgi:hypothetical protein